MAALPYFKKWVGSVYTHYFFVRKLGNLDRLIANGADFPLFKPLLDAFVVIDMPCIAGKLNNLFILAVAFHADYALSTSLNELVETPGWGLPSSQIISLTLLFLLFKLLFLPFHIDIASSNQFEIHISNDEEHDFLVITNTLPLEGIPWAWIRIFFSIKCAFSTLVFCHQPIVER